MSTCPRCGDIIPDDTSFCPKCGENLTENNLEVSSTKASAFYSSRFVAVAKILLIVMTSIKLIMALICSALFVLSAWLPLIWILFALPALYGWLAVAFGITLILKLYKQVPRQKIVVWTAFALVFTSFVSGILLLVAPIDDVD